MAGLLVACLLVMFSTTPARAAPQVEVRSEGSCPSAEQISTALAYMLKASGADSPKQAGSQILILSVADLGASYRAALAGQARGYEDPARDCEERARVVAVFAAVIIEPPELAAREQGRAPPRREHVELRAGAVADAGLQNDRRGPGWGGEVRAALVGKRLGVELGVGAQTGDTLAWGDYRARITRFPMDISVRGSVRGNHSTASLSLGLAAAFFTLRGTGGSLPVQDSGTRFDLGAVTALSLLLFPARGVSPFVTVHASLWPRPYQVVVEPLGEVGSTPVLWLGATLGLATVVP